MTINVSVLPAQTPGLPNTGGGGTARVWPHARALTLLVLVVLLGGTIAASGMRQRQRL